METAGGRQERDGTSTSNLLCQHSQCYYESFLTQPNVIFERTEGSAKLAPVISPQEQC